MRHLARLFKAAADETRLDILVLLIRHGELCVCDVERVLDITQSKASRHLRYLFERGLLEDRREGLWVHYRVRSDLDSAEQAVLDMIELGAPTERVTELDRRMKQWLAQKA